MGNYSNEAIVALKPDLVLAAEINTPDQVKSLETLGLTVYYLKNPNTLEDMYKNLQIVAQLSGHEAETENLITSLKARVAAVDAKLAGVTTTDRLLRSGRDRPHQALYIRPRHIRRCIDHGSGRNEFFGRAAGRVTDQYPQVSLEQIKRENRSADHCPRQFGVWRNG